MIARLAIATSRRRLVKVRVIVAVMLAVFLFAASGSAQACSLDASSAANDANAISLANHKARMNLGASPETPAPTAGLTESANPCCGDAHEDSAAACAGMTCVSCPGAIVVTAVAIGPENDLQNHILFGQNLLISSSTNFLFRPPRAA
jgi:hypothetical protein